MGTAMDQGDGDIAFGRRECIPTQLCANFPNASSSRIPLEETNSVTLRLFGYPFLLIQPSRHANMPLLQIMGRRHGITWTWGIILLLHECSNFMLFFLEFFADLSPRSSSFTSTSSHQNPLQSYRSGCSFKWIFTLFSANSRVIFKHPLITSQSRRSRIKGHYSRRWKLAGIFHPH